MKLALGLFFVCECDLGASVSEEAYIEDSSTYGYSLMVSRVTSAEVREEIKFKEKWRFQRKQCRAPTSMVSPEEYAAQGRLSPLGGHFSPYVPVTDIADSAIRGFRPNAGLGANTKFGKQLSQQASMYMESTPSRRVPTIADDEELIEVPNAIPVVHSRWSVLERWRLLVARPWRHPEIHINIKEAKVCVMGLRRSCRTVDNMGKIVFTLSDNLVSVLCFDKGRSRGSSIWSADGQQRTHLPAESDGKIAISPLIKTYPMLAPGGLLREVQTPGPSRPSSIRVHRRTL